ATHRVECPKRKAPIRICDSSPLARTNTQRSRSLVPYKFREPVYVFIMTLMPSPKTNKFLPFVPPWRTRRTVLNGGPLQHHNLANVGGPQQRFPVRPPRQPRRANPPVAR